MCVTNYPWTEGRGHRSLETKKEEEERQNRRYSRASGTTAPQAAVLLLLQRRVRATPKLRRRKVNARAVLPPVRKRYYHSIPLARAPLPLLRDQFHLRCLLLYPFARNTINRAPFPTF